MNHDRTCLLCSHLLLRHIRSNQIYWLCRHCHQEVPVVKLKDRIPPTAKVRATAAKPAYAS